MAKKTLTLAHLYPKLLNIYGDYGNVLTLKKRCEWRDIELFVDEIDIGDPLKSYDMYFIGGGQDLQQIEVAKALKINQNFYREEKHRNAVFLSICGGYQLLGRYYSPADGEKLDGVGLLDAYTVASKNRFIGNVTAETDFLSKRTLVGFENHSGLTYLDGDTKPISKVLIGHGNNGEDNTEGARSFNVFGTYLHGPFLPKNPHFADYLIELALNNKYGESNLEKIDDTLEYYAHASVLHKSY